MNLLSGRPIWQQTAHAIAQGTRSLVIGVGDAMFQGPAAPSKLRVGGCYHPNTPPQKRGLTLLGRAPFFVAQAALSHISQNVPVPQAASLLPKGTSDVQ